VNKRIRGALIPKKQFERMVAQDSGATITLSYDVRPDWAKRSHNPKVDYILFWPFEGPQKCVKSEKRIILMTPSVG